MAPERILPGVAFESDMIGTASVAVAEIAPERGDFHLGAAGFVINQNNAEMRTYPVRARKILNHFFRPCIRRNVIVFRPVAHQPVAYAAPHQVCLAPLLVQAAYNFRRQTGARHLTSFSHRPVVSGIQYNELVLLMCGLVATSVNGSKSSKRYCYCR